MVLQGQESGFLRRPAVPAAGSPAPGDLVGGGSGGMLTGLAALLGCAPVFLWGSPRAASWL